MDWLLQMTRHAWKSVLSLSWSGENLERHKASVIHQSTSMANRTCIKVQIGSVTAIYLQAHCVVETEQGFQYKQNFYVNRFDKTELYRSSKYRNAIYQSSRYRSLNYRSSQYKSLQYRSSKYQNLQYGCSKYWSSKYQSSAVGNWM